MTPPEPTIADPRHLKERLSKRERERDEAYLDLIEADTDETVRGKAKADWNKLDTKVKALKKKLEALERV